PAVRPLELRERRHEARLRARRPADVLHWPVACHPREAGRARRHALDALRAEADFLDVDSRRKVLGHGIAPHVMSNAEMPALTIAPYVNVTVCVTAPSKSPGITWPSATGSGDVPGAPNGSSGTSQNGSAARTATGGGNAGSPRR